eukprot:6958605-Heterocapsa_arctica.AAC.1
MNSEPQCLWTTGEITNDFTALRETEHMKAEDISLNCIGKADRVYIDGSATKIRASSDRAEVRALLAALEKPTGKIE